MFYSFLASSISATSLVFDSVGRGHIGSYMCIASNGVPPSISKRVDLKVQCMLTFLFFLWLLRLLLLSSSNDDGPKSTWRSSYWKKCLPEMQKWSISSLYQLLGPRWEVRDGDQRSEDADLQRGDGPRDPHEAGDRGGHQEGCPVPVQVHCQELSRWNGWQDQTLW